jgi:hypothetical protein
MSLKPPALVVVIALTGRFGQSSAMAGEAAATANAADSRNLAMFIVALLSIPASRSFRHGAHLTSG